MSIANLIEAVRNTQLLDDDQLHDLTHALAQRCYTPKVLSQELLAKGWVTKFQLDEILNGRGSHLSLGQYVLLQKLGEGGMGQVFKAQHRYLRRFDAIKLIHPEQLREDPNALRRFQREIRVMAMVKHPNLVMVHDANVADIRYYLAMELLEGLDVSKWVKDNGPMAVKQASECIRQAALGMQHYHECQLVHRDIKPSNLFFLANAGGADSVWIKILDLGLALLKREAGDESSALPLTKEGSFMGTADYVAPEQILDAHTADIRADIYSLGCTFYFMLTGQPPFPGGDLGRKIARHLQVIPTKVEQLRPEVVPEVSYVLSKMLAKRPEERFQVPNDLSAALKAIKFDADIINENISDEARLLPDTLTAHPHYSVASETPTPSPAPDTNPIEKKILTNSIGMQFALIPPGSFLMGSPETEFGRGDDEHQHTVTITRPFYMGVYPVTQGQWEKVFGPNSSWFPRRNGNQEEAAERQNAMWPVERVSFAEAEEFCRLLGALIEEVFVRHTYRLPTEAEWEYACRASTASAFYFGDSLGSLQANFDGKFPYGGGLEGPALNRTSPVGEYEPNAFGLYDMHGNVWEWCSDWYSSSYYKTSSKDDPTGPFSGEQHILRGGSWCNGGTACRSAVRVKNPPGDRSNSFGFRVVLCGS